MANCAFTFILFICIESFFSKKYIFLLLLGSINKDIRMTKSEFYSNYNIYSGSTFVVLKTFPENFFSWIYDDAIENYPVKFTRLSWTTDWEALKLWPLTSSKLFKLEPKLSKSLFVHFLIFGNLKYLGTFINFSKNFKRMT